MPDGKWIDNLGPGVDVAEAARQVLGVRFRVVRDCLPSALHQAADDTEHVHQLRVATRRADAALRIFEALLPRKAYKHARRVLRRLRRAAGAARDWDVFLQDLLTWKQRQPAGDHPGIDLLAGYALGQRAAAQKELEGVGRGQEEGFEALLADTLKAVRDPHPSDEKATLGALARTTLTVLEGNLEAAAAADLKDYARLHQVRIAGKRLRYALEVFVDCLPPHVRATLYPRVEEMQEILGRANDSHGASQRLSALKDQLRHVLDGDWQRLQPGIEHLLQFHRRRLPRERQRFLKWWELWRRNRPEFAWRKE